MCEGSGNGRHHFSLPHDRQGPYHNQYGLLRTATPAELSSNPAISACLPIPSAHPPPQDKSPLATNATFDVRLRRKICQLGRCAKTAQFPIFSSFLAQLDPTPVSSLSRWPLNCLRLEIWPFDHLEIWPRSPPRGSAHTTTQPQLPAAPAHAPHPVPAATGPASPA